VRPDQATKSELTQAFLSVSKTYKATWPAVARTCNHTQASTPNVASAAAAAVGYYLFGVRIHSPKYRQVQLIRCLLIQKRLAHDATLLITANSVTLNTSRNTVNRKVNVGGLWVGGGWMGGWTQQRCCSSAKVKMDRVNTELIFAVA